MPDGFPKDIGNGGVFKGSGLKSEVVGLRINIELRPLH
ncbi:MAG: hypothetical protein G01um101416_1085 [Microgenomates group bacterium Gr01-1014_16]|nr:MAG: hypothetical protein G01um101416_1085 [Microgenomates group bacterium Gr01-1014_16]